MMIEILTILDWLGQKHGLVDKSKNETKYETKPLINLITNHH